MSDKENNVRQRNDESGGCFHDVPQVMEGREASVSLKSRIVLLSWEGEEGLVLAALEQSSLMNRFS